MSWAHTFCDECRFKRCFVSLGPMLHVAYGCGMRFSAVDSAFSKHTIYRDGQMHLLTTRDGNNKTIVLAWAICETESSATYEYFAEQCHGRYCQDTLLDLQSTSATAKRASDLSTTSLRLKLGGASIISSAASIRHRRNLYSGINLSCSNGH